MNEGIGSFGLLYLALLVGGGIYFYRRKKSDALLIGFGACGLYFLPAVFGTVQFPYGANNEFYMSSIAPGAYGVMILVVGTLIGVTACYDRLAPLQPRRVAIFDNALPEVLMAVTAVGLAASLVTVNKNYLCIEKGDMLAHINGWYYIASYGAPFALVSGVAARKWGIVVFSALVLMADIFVGFRAATSVAVIALCLAYGQALFGGMRQRAIFIVVALTVGAGLFVVKQLAWNIKYTVSMDCSQQRVEGVGVTPWMLPPATGREALSPEPRTPVFEVLPTPETNPTPVFDVAPSPLAATDEDEEADNEHTVHFHLGNLRHTTNLLFSTSTYVDALRYSEPMVTQAILNEVVKQEFSAPFPNIFGQVVAAVPGGRSIFHLGSAGVSSFNEQFQPALFPNATFGMANNPWAQAYAGGGWALVFGFALVYAVGLAVLAGLTARVPPVIGAVFSVLAGWWGFYLHRNDVLTELGILQMTVFIAIIALTINFVFGRFAEDKRLSKLEHR